MKTSRFVRSIAIAAALSGGLSGMALSQSNPHADHQTQGTPGPQAAPPAPPARGMQGMGDMDGMMRMMRDMMTMMERMGGSPEERTRMMERMRPMMRDMMPMMQGMMGGAAGPAGSHADHAQAVPADASPSTRAFLEANQRMHRDMAIAFTGDADVDFVRGMIPHHQGAIDMARIVLQYGKNETARKWANDIVREQQREIEGMREWLRANVR